MVVDYDVSGMDFVQFVLSGASAGSGDLVDVYAMASVIGGQ
jgi:hypothetical protein